MPLIAFHRDRAQIDGERRVKLRTVAVLIWILSRQCKLGGLYLSQATKQRGTQDRDDFDEMELGVLLFGFMKDPHVRRLVEEAVDEPECELRVKADDWLVKSCLVEHILRANRGGKSIQPGVIIETYLRYWSHRPVPLSVRPFLVKLTHQSDTRKNFLRRLRRDWGLKPGPLPPLRTMTASETQTAVIWGPVVLLDTATKSRECKWCFKILPRVSGQHDPGPRRSPGGDLFAVAPVLNRCHLSGQEVCRIER